jgi:two-component system response regulator YesN
VNKVRVSHGVSLLLSTDMKAYEIAMETGFRDARAFTEAFSRIYGETPSSYKKRVLEKK